MPRPLFSNKVTENLELNINSSQNLKLDQQSLEKRLRQKRSKEYMDSISKLDLGGSNQCNKQFDDCVSSIKKEFSDIPSLHQLVGILSKCYLGENYEVHSLDLIGNIVTHYRSSDNIPGLLERARGLANHEEYQFVEVYTDMLCAVKKDGSISIVK